MKKKSNGPRSQTLFAAHCFYIKVDDVLHAMFVTHENGKMVRYFKRIINEDMLQVRDKAEVRRLNEAVDREWGTRSNYEQIKEKAPRSYVKGEA